MCTAVYFKSQNSYFGRNFDLDISYGEKIIITPRNYVLNLKNKTALSKHHSMIGIGTVRKGYPLYYDAVNEFGLGAAGLNFPFSAKYKPLSETSENLAPFELIPYILGCCKSIDEAKELLKKINLVPIPFSDRLPSAPLHWIFADKDNSIVAEPRENGLNVYENPVGILTNEPPFPYHIQNLNNHLYLSTDSPENTFSPDINLSACSFGMGSIGLPGDFSSPSRFIRASFVKENSLCNPDECSEISQFFHILDSVAQYRGCVRTRGSQYEFTEYSCCCNLKTLVYYYKTYENSSLSAVSLFNEDPELDHIVTYPLNNSGQVTFQN